MRKIIIAALLVTAVLTLTACGNQEKENYKDSIGGASSQAESKGENSTGGETGNSTQSGEDENPLKAVFGKVSAITGNELDFSLAKDPYAGEAPGGEDVGMKIEGGGTVAVEMAPSVNAGGVEIVGGGEAPKMKLEYTGKSERYTIPAGVKIHGLTGEEIQLENLKKGNVLMVMMNGDTVTEIAVLE